ncbi:Gp49 family protein [Pantoea sp. S18]|uniref:Gp49 family protein n=1 Tax=Pantoea sp. S18 TaxID=3019892 RepID=UPI002B1EE1D0|nr:Gp49 family protein [Pantoea sp. S18]MEA5104701.1 Gp49 family protein [Pantoea sp. S18]
MNDQQIEQEIVQKGKTAPRVTPSHVESIITSETYFTAADGRSGANIRIESEGGEKVNQVQELDDFNQLKLLTFCVLVLENGFTVTGESACASPENFDAEIGRKIARQNAVNKIWLLEGYLLKQKLYDEP